MQTTELSETCSLTEFQQDVEEHVNRVVETRQPMFPTSNGTPNVVLLDVESYEQMLEAIDRAEAIDGIREGLESMRQGRGRPAHEFFEELRHKYNLPAKRPYNKGVPLMQTTELSEICSLTEFEQDVKEHVNRVIETRQPMFLASNGAPNVVLLDVESYEQMLDAIDYAEAVEGIRQGLDDVENGRTVPAEQVLEEIRRELGLPSKP